MNSNLSCPFKRNQDEMAAAQGHPPPHYLHHQDSHLHNGRFWRVGGGGRGGGVGRGVGGWGGGMLQAVSGSRREKLRDLPLPTREELH